MVELCVRRGQAGALTSAFQQEFAPAISAQPGFRRVELLATESDDTMLLMIAFQSEDLRLAWVASDAHARVWPALASSIESFNGRTLMSVGSRTAASIESDSDDWG